MGMHTYHKVKDMLCEELERVASKGELTAGSLEVVDKLTHSIKSIDTIMAMADYEDDYSERGSSYARQGGNRGGRRGGGSSRGYSRDGYENDMSYDGMSYARRDGRGRYSRDDSKEHMINKLEEMAMGSTDERMKATINKCISELERD